MKKEVKQSNSKKTKAIVLLTVGLISIILGFVYDGVGSSSLHGFGGGLVGVTLFALFGKKGKH